MVCLPQLRDSVFHEASECIHRDMVFHRPGAPHGAFRGRKTKFQLSYQPPYQLSPPSSLTSRSASLATHHTPSFPAPSVRSTGNTSSTKSKNYSFELASRQRDSQAIPYVKEPQYPLQRMEYHAKK